MSGDQGFDTWLSKKLESLAIDDEILSSYISSVVTSDDSYSDKKETLKDIMLGVTQQELEIDNLCSEVLDQWSECIKKAVTAKDQEEKTDVAQKVALIMEQQAQPVIKVINRSSEEEKLREAILSRCTYVSSEEEDEGSEEGAASGAVTSQNQNVEAIVQAEKERRDKLKAEAEKKKAQDKVNKEKQKQKQDERREKERKRTQKREHKR